MGRINPVNWENFGIDIGIGISSRYQLGYCGHALHDTKYKSENLSNIDQNFSLQIVNPRVCDVSILKEENILG